MSNPEIVESDKERDEKTQRKETPEVYHNRIHLFYDMNGK